MAKDKYKLESTKDLLSLITNLEYYNNQIYEMLEKESNNNLNKFGVTEEIDRDAEIQLACLTACMSTKEWIDDCIRNYRILIQKANLGIVPSTSKEKDNVNMEQKESEPRTSTTIFDS